MITGLQTRFEGHEIFCQNPSGRTAIKGNTGSCRDKTLAEYIFFRRGNPAFTPPFIRLDPAFQQAVWQILLQIPYGKTMTYGEIAREMAKRQQVSHMSAQAVGGAVGHNAISIIIPCHRVIGANGSLTGYAGGIDKKAALLELERTVL